MALPEPPPNVPRIVEVQNPASGHHVVMVRMPTNLANKFPDKPWGTSIADIGLSKKDSDQYPGYTLVDVEPMKGSPDLYWIFQKLDGPVWTTKSKGQDSLVPAKYRRLITTTRAKQEVSPATEPSDIAAPLIQSVVEQQDNTGKALKVDTSETINVDSDPLVGGRTSEWGVLTSSERVVNEGSAVPHAEGVAQASVNPFGNGKAEESKLLYPADVDGVIGSLEDLDTDPQTGAITNITKMLVTNSKLASVMTGFGAGYFLETKQQDQHHTVLIASRMTTRPPLETYWTSENIRLPDQLEEILVLFNKQIGGGNGTSFDESGNGFSGSASVNASASISPSISFKLSAGFSGRTKAKVTRSYQDGPPNASAEPFNIVPVSGSVTLIGSSRSVSGSVTKTISDTRSGTSISNRESIGSDTRVIQIGPFLNDSVPINGSDAAQTPTYTGQNQGTFAFASARAEGQVIISLGTSTPDRISSGQMVARYQRAERWRLGVWVVETVEVYAP